MLTATELRQKAESDNNQRLVIVKYTNQLYWIPRERAEKGILPSEERLEGNAVYLRPIPNHFFNNRPVRIMEIGGLAREVIVLHNHELPYADQLTKKDFFDAIDSGVWTASIPA